MRRPASGAASCRLTASRMRFPGSRPAATSAQTTNVPASIAGAFPDPLPKFKEAEELFLTGALRRADSNQPRRNYARHHAASREPAPDAPQATKSLCAIAALGSLRRSGPAQALSWRGAISFARAPRP